MRTFVLLVAYASMLATVGAALLRRADWVQRAPRLGTLAWLSLSWSVVGSLLLAGIALTVPSLPVASNMAEFLHGCVVMIQAQYATPGGAVTTSAGLLLTTAVAGRVALCLLRSWRAASHERRRQLDVLALVGRRTDNLNATIVDHDIAEVYCVPGRRGKIVVTSGAVNALDDDQMAAVLAHERAHLRARHDLLIAATSSLAHAVPVPPFAVAEEEIRRLSELAADDAAVRHADRLALAEAILTVAGQRTPAGALAAGDTAAATRVRRLLSPHHRLGTARGALISLVVAAVITVPVWVATSPAVAADTSDCPLPTATQPTAL
jgi:beta-lactamase regulating signal transducer with metallopeptidase domain